MAELKTYTSCINCDNTFENCDPLVLPCLHSVCPSCYERLQTENANACPLCFEPFPTNLSQHVATDRRRKLVPEFIKAKSKGFGYILCHECDENNVSVKCKDCDRLLCAQCLKSHDKFIKGHKTVGVDELKDMPFLDTILPLPCPIKGHQNLPLKRFCHTDQTVICDLCEVTSHKADNDHRVENIETVRLKKKQDLENAIAKCKDNIDAIDHQAVNVQNEIDQLIQGKQQQENEIDASINNIIEWFERKRRDLKEGLRNKVDTLEGAFNNILKSITNTKDALEENSIIAQCALEYVGPEDFCQIESLISKRHQALIERARGISAAQLPNQEKMLILPVNIVKLDELLYVNSWLSLIEYTLDVPDEITIRDAEEDFVNIATLTVNNVTNSGSIKPFDIVFRNADNEELQAKVTYDDRNKWFDVAGKTKCTGIHTLQLLLGRKQLEDRSLRVLKDAEDELQKNVGKNQSPKDKLDHMDHDEAVQRELLCPVCKGEFQFEMDKFPKYLPCLHVVGTDCLNNCVRDGQLICPICEEKHEIKYTNFDGLPKDYSRQSLAIYLKLKKDKNLVHCEEHDSIKASCFCQTCGKSLCDTCSKRSHSQKGHFVTSIEDLAEEIQISQLQSNTLCDENGHGDKHIEFYCTKCHCLICSKCYLEQHYMHKVENYENVYEKHLAELKDVRKKITEMKQMTEELGEAVDNELFALDVVTDKELDKVRCTFNNHKLALDERKRALERQVEGIRDCKKQVLKQQQHRLKTTQTKLNEVLSRAEDFLTFSNKITFIKNFHFVVHRMQNAVEMHVDTTLSEQSLLLFLETKGTKRFENETENLGKIWPGSINLPSLEYEVGSVTLNTECLLVSIQFKNKDNRAINIKDIKSYIETVLLGDKGDTTGGEITQLDAKENGILDVKGKIKEPGKYRVMVKVANLTVKKDGFTVNVNATGDRQDEAEHITNITVNPVQSHLLTDKHDEGRIASTNVDSFANHYEKGYSTHNENSTAKELRIKTEISTDNNDNGHFHETGDAKHFTEKATIEKSGELDMIADISDRGPLLEQISTETLVLDVAPQTNDTEAITTDVSTANETNFAGQATMKSEPGAPRDPFHATIIGYTEVCLTWLPPAYDGGCPVSSYVLEWQENENERWASTDIPTAEQPTHEKIQPDPVIKTDGLDSQKVTYTVTWLKDGATYLFRVRAKNSQGSSESLLMERTISTKAYTAPGPPMTFTGDFDMHEKCIVLSWKPPEENGGRPVTGYSLEYCPVDGTDWVQADNVKDDTRWRGSACFTGGVVYRFRVIAQNEKGRGEPCQLERTVKFLSSPDKPVGPLAVSHINWGQLKISWKPPVNYGGSPITSYIVSKQLSLHDGKEEEIGRTQGTQYSVTGLVPGTRHRFYVRAQNSIGTSDAIEVQVETGARPQKPGAPRDPFDATGIGYTKVCLSLLPPAYDGGCPVSSYVLEWQENENERWVSTEIPTAEQNIHPMITTEGMYSQTLTYTVTGLKDGTTYSFRVRAKNSQPLLMERTISTKAYTAPGPPMAFTGDFDMRQKCIVLSWKPPKENGGRPVTGYTLGYCPVDGTDWVRADYVKNDTCWRGSSGFIGGAVYRFGVTAQNKKGRGKPCQLDRTIKFLSAPDRPVGPLEVSNIYCDQLKLSWKPPVNDGGSPVTSYIVSKWLYFGCLEEIGRTKETQYNVTGLVPGTRYRFYVRAENIIGTSDAIEVKTGTLP